MTQTRKYLLTSLFLFLVGMAYASPAKADPLQFSNVIALQNGGSTSVDLFANPGVTLYGPQISFMVDVAGTLPPGGFDQLFVTFTEAGSAPMSFTFDIPFGDVAPPLSFLFTFTSPGANFQGVPGVLTVDLLNSTNDFVIPAGLGAGQGVNSYSFTFNSAQPVPEPASLTLATIGLAGLIARARKRRKTRRTTD
jgi:PEP-CTERM motif